MRIALCNNRLRDRRDVSSFNIVRVNPAAFADARGEFDRYDDHAIMLIDPLTGVLADERDIEHVFAFDGDFRTLGFTVVPEDTGEGRVGDISSVFTYGNW